MVGGNRAMDQELTTLFVRNIPDGQYKAQKLDLAEEVVSTSSSKPATAGRSNKPASSSSTSQKSTFPQHKINKIISTLHNLESKAVKCTRCGGFGHKATKCPTRTNVCHNCGQTDHFANDRKYINVILYFRTYGGT